MGALSDVPDSDIHEGAFMTGGSMMLFLSPEAIENMTCVLYKRRVITRSVPDDRNIYTINKTSES